MTSQKIFKKNQMNLPNRLNLTWINLETANQISQQIIPQVELPEPYSLRINKNKWIQFKVLPTFQIYSLSIDNLIFNSSLAIKISIYLKTSNLNSKVKWLSFKKDKVQSAVCLHKVTKAFRLAIMLKCNLNQVKITWTHHSQIWTKSFLINGQIFKTAIRKQDSSQADQLSLRPQLNLLRQSMSDQLEYETQYSLAKIAQTN
jgi:hypothetical protein